MYHQIVIVGNLGKAPEMRYTPAGHAVTNFPVATNRSWTDANGETVKETIWFRVTAWGKLGEICNQYLAKGSRVLIVGRLHADPATGSPRVWQDTNGSMRASFEVVAETVRFLSERREQAAVAPSSSDSDSDSDLDGIPF